MSKKESLLSNFKLYYEYREDLPEIQKMLRAFKARMKRRAMKQNVQKNRAQ